MKRFHIHVAVEDLGRSVRFYSVLFADPPTVLKGDYAKWMLEDPRVNFAKAPQERPPLESAATPHQRRAILRTRMARAVADAKFSREAVEKRAREEIDALDLDDPMALILHCFRMPGAKDVEFICTPHGGGYMRVDTVSFEESEPLAAGPFAGKRVQMPAPDTDADEE